MEVRKDVVCEARDGVELATNVYLPDGDGEYPAILALLPYGKELQEAVLFQPRQPRQASTLWDGTIEAMDMRYTTANGYAHVVADVRGTGDSGGQFTGFYANDGEDGYDLVEWIAEQPWCNGKVATCGRSWLGTNQLLIAAENPPHLEAAFASGIFTDLYRENTYQGGVLDLFHLGLWSGEGEDSGIVDNDAASRTKQKLGEEAFQRKLDEALEDPRVKQYTNLYQLLNYPEKNPSFVDLFLNDTDNWFYEERSPHHRLDQIDTPIYLSCAWGGKHAIPLYTAYEGIDTEKLKVMVTPARMLERPYHEYKEEMIRWFDAILKDEDDGILAEPPVKMYVNGAGRWRFEDRLIPDRTRWTPLYLRNHHRLLHHPEPLESMEPSGFSQPPPNVSSRVSTLTFETARFDAAMEVTGPIALVLHAAISAEDTTWMGRVYDLHPSGERVVVSKGYLRASHRALDPDRSAEHWPHHTHADPTPVEPGEINEYHIRFSPTSLVVESGHRLALELFATDLPATRGNQEAPGAHHLPEAETVAHQVYHSHRHPSRLVIPVMEDDGATRWIEDGSAAHPGPVL